MPNKKDLELESKHKEQRAFNVNTYSNAQFKQNKSFCSNQIKTAKYNIFTFLPLALFYQFYTAFNFFFLFQAVLLSIPLISSLDPFTSIMPFVVILIISLIREAFEDFRKYQYDRLSNNSIGEHFKLDTFGDIKWADMQIGEIIKVKKNQIIPADILVIKSSASNGICYLETTNLDGENTLKPRDALSVTQKNINDDSSISTLLGDARIEVDPPSMDIYSAEGTAFVTGHQNIYFDIKNILLRGGKLKNVDYVYGIVIYTGKDTKLMKNINRSSLKFSVIDRKTDIIVIYILVITLLICTISTIVGSLFRNDNMPDYANNLLKADYMLYYNITEKRNDALEIARIFTGHFTTFCTLIPISIVIMLAVVKALQAIVLEFFEPSVRLDPDDKMKCISTTLQEEMGMVKYIFTDKTGTLTQNEMEFKACSIFTLLFDDEEEKEAANGNDQFSLKFSIGRTRTTHDCTSKFSKTFSKQKVFDDLHRNIPLQIQDVKGCPFDSQNEAIQEFFINLGMNHDVLSEYDSESQTNVFQGANPDERTLVTAAAEMGFRYIERHDKIIKLGIKNADEEEIVKSFEVLQKFDFTSSRQRSSIIVRDIESNKIKLYLKGSDTKVFESVDSFSLINILPKSKEHVDSFARRGLRTLCYSFKNIDENKYNDWAQNYMDIKYKSINDKSLYPELERAISDIESQATLLGASALEDKLQEEVKTDLQRFIEADINVWMITGDKMDTAESIGHSCKLFSDDTEVFKIKSNTDVSKVIERMKEIQGEMKILECELKQISKASDDGNVFMNKPEDDLNKCKEEQTTTKMVLISKPEENINKNDIQFDNMPVEKKENNSEGELKTIRYISLSCLDCERRNCLNNNNVPLYCEDFDELETIRIPEENLNIHQSNVMIEENDEDSKDPFSNINKTEPNVNLHYLKQSINFIKLPRRKSIHPATQNMESNINEIQNDFNPSEGLHDVSIIRFMADKQCFDNSDVKYDNMTILKDKVRKVSISKENSNEQFGQNVNSKRNSIKDIEIKIKSDRKKAIRAIPTSEKKFNEYYNHCRKQLMQIRQTKQQLFNLTNKKYESFDIEMNFSLIIEGQSISSCITPGEAGDLFWDLINKSKSLICCRCSPIQKAQVVEFVKKRSDKITLAIGDGGNDVNMIKSAHVGIGLFGKEGYQAAYNSDYAISQFKYLKRLLFVIGRFTLERNSYFIYCYFFKNIAYTLPQLWMCICSGFSGVNLYDEWLYTSFNTYCTILPVAARAITEEDFDPDESSNLNQKQIIKYLLPDIYKEYRDRIPFNVLKFFSVFAVAAIFSVPNFFIPAYSFQFSVQSSYGIGFSYWDTSLCSFISVIALHFFMVSFDTLFYNWFIVAFYGAQLLINILFFVIYEACNYGTEISGIIYPILDNPIWWFTLIMASSMSIIPYYIYIRVQFYFGDLIVNKIKLKKTDQLCIEKYYKKKLAQMTRATRSVAKFKKIYKVDNRVEYDNLVDQQMKKIVDEFKEKRKKTKLHKKQSMFEDDILK